MAEQDLFCAPFFNFHRDLSDPEPSQTTNSMSSKHLPLAILAILPLSATAAVTVFNFDDYDGTGAAGSGTDTVTVVSATDGAVSMTITASHTTETAELWADTVGLGVWVASDSNATRRNSLDTVNGGVETMTFKIDNSSGSDRYVTDFTVRRDDRPGAMDPPIPAGYTDNLTAGSITLNGGGTSLGGFTGTFGVLSDANGGTATPTVFNSTNVQGPGSFPPIGYLVVPAGGSLEFEWVNTHINGEGVLDTQLAWRSITIIPEPSRAMLVLFGFGTVLLRRRRST